MFSVCLKALAAGVTYNSLEAVYRSAATDLAHSSFIEEALELPSIRAKGLAQTLSNLLFTDDGPTEMVPREYAIIAKACFRSIPRNFISLTQSPSCLRPSAMLYLPSASKRKIVFNALKHRVHLAGNIGPVADLPPADEINFAGVGAWLDANHDPIEPLELPETPGSVYRYCGTLSNWQSRVLNDQGVFVPDEDLNPAFINNQLNPLAQYLALVHTIPAHGDVPEVHEDLVTLINRDCHLHANIQWAEAEFLSLVEGYVTSKKSYSQGITGIDDMTILYVPKPNDWLTQMEAVSPVVNAGRLYPYVVQKGKPLPLLKSQAKFDKFDVPYSIRQNSRSFPNSASTKVVLFFSHPHVRYIPIHVCSIPALAHNNVLRGPGHGFFWGAGYPNFVKPHSTATVHISSNLYLVPAGQ
jgi:hypothetical protein